MLAFFLPQLMALSSFRQQSHRLSVSAFRAAKSQQKAKEAPPSPKKSRWRISHLSNRCSELSMFFFIIKLMQTHCIDLESREKAQRKQNSYFVYVGVYNYFTGIRIILDLTGFFDVLVGCEHFLLPFRSSQTQFFTLDGMLSCGVSWCVKSIFYCWLYSPFLNFHCFQLFSSKVLHIESESIIHRRGKGHQR